MQILIQNTNNGNVIDLSQLVTNVTIETTMLEQPGKCEFEYLDDGKTYFGEGSHVAITVDKHNLFYGYTFKRGRSQNAINQITAYDQMRYLQNKDVMVTADMSSADIFEKICKEQQLKYKIVHSAAYKPAPKVHDNTSYYEMIQYGLDQTLIGTGEWYIIRDNFNVLEHVAVSKLVTQLVIGDGSLLTGYEFESSIDGETYNQVKLVKENKETGKRELYIAKDSDTIARWGRLQYFESVDEKANEAQIKTKADMILKLKNHPERSLKLSCLGHVDVRAGVGITLNVTDLENEKVPQNQSALVYACSHKFGSGLPHTMDLELLLL